MKDKYNILKKIYHKYLIIICKNNKKYTYSYDKIILNTYDINNVNIIYVNNLEIEKKEVVDNKYEEYYIKAKLINMIEERNKKIYEKDNVNNSTNINNTCYK